MYYAVFFTDNDDFAHMRTRYMPDHLAFLERHSDAIVAAGPLMDTDIDRPAGGLWLVTAADSQQVRELVESDPLWPTGLRQDVRILAWNRVFADGIRQA